MRFRSVGSAEKEAYRQAVRAASVTAGDNGAHFWTFEVDGGEGVFVEFLEGPSDGTLARLDEATRESLRAAGGQGPTAYHVKAEGIGSTEFR